MFTSLECRLEFTRRSAFGTLSDRSTICDDYVAIVNRFLRLSILSDYQDHFAAAGDFDSSNSSIRRAFD